MRSQTASAEAACETFPAAEAIRSHVERVLASPQFSGTPRLAGFLAFVVNTTLAGDAEQIKESLIAVEVYGRRPDYNPQVDSTVRVEAGRLRARLRQYYDGPGEDEAVRIELPKGAYVPVFRECRRSEARAATPGRPVPRNAVRWSWLLLPAASIATVATFLSCSAARDRGAIESLAVLPFANLSDDRSTGHLSDALTEELTTLLARDTRARVTARTITARYKNAAADVDRIGRDHGVQAVLEGTVRRDGDRIVVTTLLIDTRNGYHLWADRYVRSAAAAQTDLAAAVVSNVRPVIHGRARRPQADSGTTPPYRWAQNMLGIPALKNGPHARACRRRSIECPPGCRQP
jgi:TolB-like protein